LPTVEDAVRSFFIKTGQALKSGESVTLTAAEAKAIRARLIAFGFLKGSIAASLDEAAERERTSAE
jgi:hypothetical protein